MTKTTIDLNLIGSLLPLWNVPRYRVFLESRGSDTSWMLTFASTHTSSPRPVTHSRHFRHLHRAAAAAPRPTGCQYFYNLHPLWPLAPLLAPVVSAPPPLLTTHTLAYTHAPVHLAVPPWIIETSCCKVPLPLTLHPSFPLLLLPLLLVVVHLPLWQKANPKYHPLLSHFPFLYSYPPLCQSSMPLNVFEVTCANW